MKKVLLLGTFLLSLLSGSLYAQLVAQIGFGTETPSLTLYSPIYRYSSSSATAQAKSVIIYSEAELATAGIFPGDIINSLSFNKTNDGYFLIPANYSILMDTTLIPTLSTSTVWSSILSTHTQVYNDPALTLSAATGWYTFAITPYTYDGGNLTIATDLTMTGGSTGASNNITWEYTNGFADKLIASTATSADPTLNGTVSGYRHRPNIRFGYTSNAPACTLAPGSIVATASADSLCMNESVSLTTTGFPIQSGFHSNGKPLPMV